MCPFGTLQNPAHEYLTPWYRTTSVVLYLPATKGIGFSQVPVRTAALDEEGATELTATELTATELTATELTATELAATEEVALVPPSEDTVTLSEDTVTSSEDIVSSSEEVTSSDEISSTEEGVTPTRTLSSRRISIGVPAISSDTKLGSSNSPSEHAESDKIANAEIPKRIDDVFFIN